MKLLFFPVIAEHASFFIRIAKAIEDYHEITFISIRYDTYLFIRKAGYSCLLLQNYVAKSQYDSAYYDRFMNDAVKMDVNTGRMKPETANRIFRNMTSSSDKFFAENSFDLVCIWNGSLIQPYAMALSAEKAGIDRLFFEIGNFKNKFFVDHKGVNFKSSLTNIDLSICPDFDQKALDELLDNYKRTNENKHVVPQAMKKKLNYSVFYYFMYNLITANVLIDSEETIIQKFRRILKFNHNKREYDSYDYAKGRYVFMPLQVSKDSQIVRNSDISLTDAVKYALRRATEQGLDLVIKPHPAESSYEVTEYVEQLKAHDPRVYLVNGNTFQIIKHAESVITVNSTTGLEALMYDKPLEVLGNTFYKRYASATTEKRQRFLYNYLFNVLVEGNYFQDTPLDVKRILQIIQNKSVSVCSRNQDNKCLSD